MNNTDLWVEKYRPSKLSDYVVNGDIREYFDSMIKKNSLQNMLFAGPAGMGKTTLARILANEFGASVLFIPCATDGTLDVLRTKLTEFCNAMAMDGRIKLVILDEIDSASSSSANNFQLGLRNLIEAASDDTRFILTCNYSTKVLPAILSRCPLIPLKFDKRDLLQRVKFILDAEKIEHDRESVKAFVEDAFQFYPDIRRIVNYLQFCSSSGRLTVKLNSAVNSDKEEFIKTVFEMLKSDAKLLDIRQYYLKNKDKISDFVAFGSDMFNYAADAGILGIDGTLEATDQLYKMNVVIDKEVGLFGLITCLKKYARA